MNAGQPQLVGKERGLYFVSYGESRGKELTPAGRSQIMRAAGDLRDELMGYSRVFFASDLSPLAADSVEFFDHAVHNGIPPNSSPFAYFYSPDNLQDPMVDITSKRIIPRGIAVRVFKGYQDLLEERITQSRREVSSAALVHFGPPRFQDLLVRSGISDQEVGGDPCGRVLSFCSTNEPEKWRVRVGQLEGLVAMDQGAKRFEPVLAPEASS